MNSTLLPIGLVLCVAAGGLLWWWPTDATASAASAEAAPGTPATTKEDPPVLSARWKAPPTVKNPDDLSKRYMVGLPNGEYVRALNGAVDASPLQWPSDRPFSPIIGVERAADGTEWWVHADGTKSTTRMVFRSDLGRHDATTEIASPTPALALEPPGLSEPRQAPKSGTAGQPGQGAPPVKGSAGQSQIERR